MDKIVIMVTVLIKIIQMRKTGRIMTGKTNISTLDKLSIVETQDLLSRIAPMKNILLIVRMITVSLIKVETEKHLINNVKFAEIKLFLSMPE